MTERDKFEQWVEETIGIPAGHLKASRWTDVDGVEGYTNLQDYGYTDRADDIMSFSWLSRKAVLDSVRDAEAEIKRSYSEIERLTGEVGQLRLNNQALERHLSEVEYKLAEHPRRDRALVARSLAEQGYTFIQIASVLRVNLSAVEELLER